MQLKSIHLLFFLIVFILIKNRLVLAGRKYFIKKIIKGAVLASLIRPNYLPLPIPFSMNQQLSGQRHPQFNLPNHHHWQPKQFYNPLPDFSYMHHPSWNHWLSNDLMSTTKNSLIPSSLINSQPINPQQFGSPISNHLDSKLNINKNLINDYLSTSTNHLPLNDNFIYLTSANDLPIELNSDASSTNFSFKKFLRNEFKK